MLVVWAMYEAVEWSVRSPTARPLVTASSAAGWFGRARIFISALPELANVLFSFWRNACWVVPLSQATVLPARLSRLVMPAALPFFTSTEVPS